MTTDWLNVARNITDPTQPSVLGHNIPDRITTAAVECEHMEPDPDTMNGRPCGWAGLTDIAIFDDTKEALWWCPDRHENSARYQ